MIRDIVLRWLFSVMKEMSRILILELIKFDDGGFMWNRTNSGPEVQEALRRTRRG